MTTLQDQIHIKRWSEPNNERYDFDFNRCHFKDGWAQVDTGQDACYFGTWANPLTFQIQTYTEGDCTLTVADSVDAFVAEIRRIKQWNDEQGWSCAIDGMCRPEIIKAFTDMGLVDLLH